MKYDFIQGDFSMGELSPRFQGHVDHPAYKAGLSRAANVLPTQQGSVASRSGAMLVSDGKAAPAPNGAPVYHIPIQDGPHGDFVLELRTGVATARLLRKQGSIPYALCQNLDSLYSAFPTGSDMWCDAVEEKIYIRNYDVAVGTPNRSFSITANAATLGNLPGQFSKLQFFYAGNGLIVEQKNGGAVITTFAISQGFNSFDFDATAGATLLFRTALGYGLAAIDIWGMKLGGGNPTRPVVDLPVTGLVVTPGMRATYFWTYSADFGFGGPVKIFVITLAGPGMTGLINIVWLGTNDDWHASAGTSGTYEGVWPDPNNTHKFVFTPPWLTLGAVTALTAYQGRIWVGLSDGSLHATQIGFGHELLSTGLIRYNFSKGYTDRAQVMAPAQTIIPFHGRATTADTVRVFKDGVEQAKITFVVTLNADQDTAPGGTITIGAAVGGESYVIWHFVDPPPAESALDLTLAQPQGPISWFEELRGLVMGTKRSEMLFSPGPLAIDPAAGSTFDIERHSGHGGDLTVGPSLVQDKIAFVAPGRQRVRLMGKNISTDGGLLSLDAGLLGEHLLRSRVRSMAFLRAPVSRLAFAFDDGTGAIATVHDNLSFAWARFTLPAPYDVYGVAGLDTANGAELWIASSEGSSFVIRDLDSFDTPKRRVVVPVVATNQAQQNVEYDAEQPTPIMDGWLRIPVKAGVTVYTGLPAAWVGLNASVMFNGNFFDPVTFAVAADGAGGGQITIPAAQATTWTDINGKLQASALVIGIAYQEHRWTSLPLEGGNPVGTSQNLTSRKPQLYLRFVDSYLPLVNGKRLAERGATDPNDVLAAKVTGDRRSTEEGFQRGSVVDVVMDLPLRMEVSAIFGGVVMNNI